MQRAANHIPDAHEINAAFNLSNGPVETPCSHHILPMTRAIPSIRCVVAATSACHLANRLADDQLHRRSLHLRLKATELLRAELENSNAGPDLARLLCMLLLAQLDVCTTTLLFGDAFLTAAGGMRWGLRRIRNTPQSCAYIYKTM